MSLPEVMRVAENRNHGATDCALPMLEAQRRGWHNVDAFQIFTDNETWYGSTHPKTALASYRKANQRESRLAVCAMTGTKNSIADPSVDYMMDIIGISPDTPRIVSQFFNGEF